MASFSSKKGPRSRRPWSAGVAPRRTRLPLRHPRIETLEPRLTLSNTAPTLAELSDATLLSGAPLYIALDGYDADGDALTFSIESTNANLISTLSQTNQSLRITALSDDGTINGEMVFELFENLAPDVTARIIELAESGFYDDLIFHRVAEYSDGTPFVIQGGDPEGDGTGGSGVEFDDEFGPLLMHTSAGVLSMAKSGDDTNDSQFFITGSSARHLDFNHSVFGYLVEGDEVREAIQNVETDDDSKPVSDVVMTSVEVFLDTENGVLILTAPEGYTDSADVTVTASDGNGGTESRTFHVTITEDTVDNYPYLQSIASVAVDAGASATATLASIDVEGDTVQYAGMVYPESDDITVSVSATTGQVTVTAASTAGGVYSIYVGVSDTDSTAWDTQYVPVLVTPAAPTSVDLLASTDTGDSDSDDITSYNNTTDKSLWFRVNGTAEGATVSLYADGVLIGQTSATSDSTIVVTNESQTLLDGTHSITAIQGFYAESVDVGNSDEVVTLVSDSSAALVITVDATAPVFTSTPVATATGGVQYVYDAESDAETAGQATYSLKTPAPSGMLIDFDTGRVTWTPKASHGAEQTVTVAVTDLAGNETTQSFEIAINQAPTFYETITNREIEEGSLLSFEVVASDPDSTTDDVSVITFSLDAGAPDGAAITATSTTTAIFTWRPTEAQGPGQYDVWIRLTDEAGATTAAKVTITVAEANQSPVLADIADASVDEGQLLDLTVSAADPDLPANALTYALAQGGPAGAAIDPATGRLTWRPGEQYGDTVVALTVVVADADGATDQQTFQVTVNEVDNAPVIQPANVQVTSPGATLRVQAEAEDPDSAANSIVYALEAGAPQGVSIDSQSGLITWCVPGNQPVGSVYLTVRATEVLAGGTLGLSTTATLEIQVATISSAAFDQVITLSRILDSPFAREALDSLLFDSAPAMRFVPAARAVPREEAPLGYRIGIDGGGGDVAVLNKAEKNKETKSDRKQPKAKAENPLRDGAAPKSESRSDEDDSSADIEPPTDQPEEVAALAPAEVLDAAMEQLTDEAIEQLTDEAAKTTPPVDA